MAFPITFRSEVLYKAPQANSEEVRPKLTESIQAKIDSLVEYPGSRKGDFGEWRLTDWLDSKLEHLVSRGGSERK